MTTGSTSADAASRRTWTKTWIRLRRSTPWPYSTLTSLAVASGAAALIAVSTHTVGIESLEAGLVWTAVAALPLLISGVRSRSLAFGAQFEALARRSVEWLRGVGASRGTVLSAESKDEPAVLRECKGRWSPLQRLVVTAQPFAVGTPDGVVVVDTPYIVVVGSAPSHRGRDAVWGSTMEITVGDRVAVVGGTMEYVERPPWLPSEHPVSTDGLERVRRLRATEEDPIGLILYDGEA